MEIRFKNQQLHQLCQKQDVATRKLGSIGARKLKARLADLMAAARVSDLVAGNPHPLKRDRRGQFALALDGGQRLVFAPANTPVASQEDGAVDWSAVTIVCIEFIGDYHG